MDQSDQPSVHQTVHQHDVQPERIVARQLARDLTPQELDQVSGGLAPVFTGRCSTVNCDIDGTCDC